MSPDAQRIMDALARVGLPTPTTGSVDGFSVLADGVEKLVAVAEAAKHFMEAPMEIGCGGRHFSDEAQDAADRLERALQEIGLL